MSDSDTSYEELVVDKPKRGPGRPRKEDSSPKPKTRLEKDLSLLKVMSEKRKVGRPRKVKPEDDPAPAPAPAPTAPEPPKPSPVVPDYTEMMKKAKEELKAELAAEKAAKKKDKVKPKKVVAKKEVKEPETSSNEELPALPRQARPVPIRHIPAPKPEPLTGSALLDNLFFRK